MLFLLSITLDHPQAVLISNMKLQLSKVTKTISMSAQTQIRESGWQWTGVPLRLSPHTIPSALSSCLVPDCSNLFLNLESLVKWEAEKVLGTALELCWLQSIKTPLKTRRSNKEFKARPQTIPHSRKFQSHDHVQTSYHMPPALYVGNHRLGQSWDQSVAHVSDHFPDSALEIGSKFSFGNKVTIVTIHKCSSSIHFACNS